VYVDFFLLCLLFIVPRCVYLLYHVRGGAYIPQTAPPTSSLLFSFSPSPNKLKAQMRVAVLVMRRPGTGAQPAATATAAAAAAAERPLTN
jgi:hypothetical protein